MVNSLNVGPSGDEAAGKILGNHIALVYDSEEERLDATASLMRFGLDKGELCIYISDKEEDTGLLQEMERQQVDVEGAVNTNRLILSNKQEFYFPQGRFDPEWTLRVIRNVAETARSHGFTAMRMISDMRWTQDDIPGASRWAEYEVKLSSLDLGLDLRMVCQYGRETSSPQTLLYVLKTHPKVVCQGTLQDNIFFIPPARLQADEGALVELEAMFGAMRATSTLGSERDLMERKLRELSARLDGEVRSRFDAERSLDEYRARLQAIYERSSEWIWEIGLDGRYSHSSPRSKDILGLMPDDVIGQRPEDLVVEEDVARVASAMARALSDRSSIRALEKRCCDSNGRTIYLEMDGDPVLNEGGILVGYRGMDRDVTRIRTSEDTIHELDREVKVLNDEVGSRDARLRALEEEVARLLSSLDAKDDEASILTKEIARKDGEIRQGAEELEALTAVESSLKTELQRLHERVEAEREEMGEQLIQRERLESKLAELETEMATLRLDMSSKEAEASTIRAMIPVLESKVESLQRENDSLRLDSLAMGEELDTNKDALSSLGAELTSTRELLSSMESEAGALRIRLSSQMSKNEEARRDRESLQAIIAARDKELKARCGELSAAADRVTALSTELSMLKEGMGVAERERLDLVAGISSLEQELTSTRLKLASANAEILASKDERDTLQETVAETTKELEKHRELLRSILCQQRIGIARIDLEGMLMEANEAFHSILGQEPGTLAGTHYREYTHKDDLVDSADMYELLRGGAGPITMMKRYIRRQGGVATVDLTLSPINDPDGKLSHHVALVYDRTEEDMGNDASSEGTIENIPRGPELARRLRDAMTVVSGSVTLAKEYVIPEGRMYGQLSQIELASREATKMAEELEGIHSTIEIPLSGASTGPVHGEGRILLVDDDEAVLETTTNMLRHLGYDVDVARDGEEAVAVCQQATEAGRGFSLAIIDPESLRDEGGLGTTSRLMSENPGLRIIVSSGRAAHLCLREPNERGFEGTLPRPYSLEELSLAVANVLQAGQV